MHTNNLIPYTTSIVAILGATGSLIAIIHNFWRDYKDRGIIKISAQISYKIGDPRIDSKIPLINIELVNIGRRKITVDNIGIYSDKNFNYIFSYDSGLPVSLEENTSHNIYYKISDDIFNLINDPKTKYIFAKDVSGKKWKLSSNNLKSLSKQISNT